MWDAISGGAPWSGVIKNRKADGSSYYKRATIVPIKNENSEIVEYLSSGQDVSEIIEKRGEIEKAFSTDSLTGLGNRMRLLGDIETMGSPALALINIRNFSGMNQTFGHDNGDMILRKLASDVFEFARSHGSVAYRAYADTFALLCPCTDDEDRVMFTKEIAARFSGISYPLDTDFVDVHMYVGIAFQGRDSFVYADMALAQAKKSGAAMHVFNPGDAGAETDSAHNINVLKMIHDAIRNQRVIPHFQPIMDVRTGKTTKYECLIRMINSDGAVIYPDDFIPVAKKTDVYQKLTLRMLEKSMDTFETSPYDFSVNLTIEDLVNEETIAYLVNESRYRQLSSRLIVEIVETEEMKDFERIVAILADLRKEGIRIAIDDFGSGYSSFEYILKLNPSFIKIDRVITQSILSDQRAYGIMKSVIEFARHSGIQTVAEYVDSAELRDTVVTLGVDYIQGWLVGKPEASIG